MAANLGEDADTTAAVCGQLAGAHYGVSGIPYHWLKLLVKSDEISVMADRLMELSAHPSWTRGHVNSESPADHIVTDFRWQPFRLALDSDHPQPIL